MSIQKQRYFIVVAVAIILVVGAWQGQALFEKWRVIKMLNSQDEKDPFAGIAIPQKYMADSATKGVIETKITATKKMYAEKPNIWETWIAIGNLRSLLEDYNGAIKAFQKSIELQSNNILGYRNIAEIYNQHLYDYEKAVAYYRLAINNQVGNPELYVNLASIYYKKLDKTEDAEKVFMEGLQKTGFHADVLKEVVVFYKFTGNTEKYRENLELLQKKNPNTVILQDQYNIDLK